MNLEPKNRGNEKVTDIKRDVVVHSRKGPSRKMPNAIVRLKALGPA